MCETIRQNLTSVVQLLAQRGAIAAAKNNYDETGFHLAIKNLLFMQQKLALLSSLSIDVNTTDNQGRTLVYLHEIGAYLDEALLDLAKYSKTIQEILQKLLVVEEAKVRSPKEWKDAIAKLKIEEDL